VAVVELAVVKVVVVEVAVVEVAVVEVAVVEVAVVEVAVVEVAVVEMGVVDVAVVVVVATDAAVVAVVVDAVVVEDEEAVELLVVVESVTVKTGASTGAAISSASSPAATLRLCSPGEAPSPPAGTGTRKGPHALTTAVRRAALCMRSLRPQRRPPYFFVRTVPRHRRGRALAFTEKLASAVMLSMPSRQYRIARL
jgi:hypothetical protein